MTQLAVLPSFDPSFGPSFEGVTGPLRLHIGGRVRKPGWQIFDIDPRPEVDFVGSCTDLSQFADASVADIYASHVLEHLSFMGDVGQAIREFFRVLVPGGRCFIAVPDFEELCRLFVRPDLSLQQRWTVMNLMFGGHSSPHDIHKCGLTREFLKAHARNAGFTMIERVDQFGLFDDASTARIADDGDSDALRNARYSLNVILYKGTVG